MAVTEPRCGACGADLDDPDVKALLASSPPARTPEAAAPETSVGVLASDRFLGFSRARILDGRALRSLGVAGAILLALAFFIPAGRDWRGYRMAWELFQGGPKLALVFPLVAALIGLVASLVPGIPPFARGAALAVGGLGGVALCVGPLGRWAYTPREVLTLANLGLVIAGVAGAMRVYWPTSRAARYALVGGGLVLLAGYVIPADLIDRLPGEFLVWSSSRGLELLDNIPLGTILDGCDREAADLFFVALWAAMPVVLIPLAVLASWRPPRDIWDRGGLLVRPLVALIFLYVPLAYALYAFNMVGWGGDELAESYLLARSRLALLVAVFFLWIEVGAIAVIGRFLPADPAAREDGARPSDRR